MIVTFALPGITLSQNKLDGKHWTAKHNQKTFWYELVMALVGRPESSMIPTIQGTKARVYIVRVSKRLIDPLNVPAGCKWLLDALVFQGWLRGDAYNDLAITTEQRKCDGDEPHMEVTIEYP